MARPKSNNPKRNRIELRVTDDELNDIEYIARMLGISKSEAILDAVSYRSIEIYKVQKERNKKM